MSHSTQRRVITIGVVGALALGAAVPAWAGPMPSAGTSLKAASSSTVTEVRWRGGHWGGAAAGFAAGAILGAAAAGAYYGNGYYGGPYYAPDAYAYDPGPTYVVPVTPYPYGYYGYAHCGRERYWDTPNDCRY